MDPARTTIIRRTILETLKNAQGYAVEVSILRNFVSTLLRPPVTDEEWTQHIEWLVKGSRIAAIESDLDETIIQYAITERGRVLLKTL
jgi:hypothetical protein